MKFENRMINIHIFDIYHLPSGIKKIDPYGPLQIWDMIIEETFIIHIHNFDISISHSVHIGFMKR